MLDGWAKLDENFQDDDKIIELWLKHGHTGLSVFWLIVAKLRGAPGYKLSLNYRTLAVKVWAEPELVKSVVEDFGLFSLDSQTGMFTSARLQRDMQVKDDNREERTSKAKKAAIARWSNKNQTATNENEVADSGCGADHFASTSDNGASGGSAPSSGTDAKDLLAGSSQSMPADANAMLIDANAMLIDAKSQSQSKSKRVEKENLNPPPYPPPVADFEKWFSRYPVDWAGIKDPAAYKRSCQNAWNALTVQEQQACVQATDLGRIRNRPPLWYLRDKDFLGERKVAANSASVHQQAMQKAYTKEDLERPFVLKNKVIEC